MSGMPLWDMTADAGILTKDSPFVQGASRSMPGEAFSGLYMAALTNDDYVGFHNEIGNNPPIRPGWVHFRRGADDVVSPAGAHRITDDEADSETYFTRSQATASVTGRRYIESDVRCLSRVRENLAIAVAFNDMGAEKAADEQTLDAYPIRMVDGALRWPLYTERLRIFDRQVDYPEAIDFDASSVSILPLSDTASLVLVFAYFDDWNGSVSTHEHTLWGCVVHNDANGVLTRGWHGHIKLFPWGDGWWPFMAGYEIFGEGPEKTVVLVHSGAFDMNPAPATMMVLKVSETGASLLHEEEFRPYSIYNWNLTIHRTTHERFVLLYREWYLEEVLYIQGYEFVDGLPQKVWEVPIPDPDYLHSQWGGESGGGDGAAGSDDMGEIFLVGGWTPSTTLEPTESGDVEFSAVIRITWCHDEYIVDTDNLTITRPSNREPAYDPQGNLTPWVQLNNFLVTPSGDGVVLFHQSYYWEDGSRKLTWGAWMLRDTDYLCSQFLPRWINGRLGGEASRFGPG